VTIVRITQQAQQAVINPSCRHKKCEQTDVLVTVGVMEHHVLIIENKFTPDAVSNYYYYYYVVVIITGLENREYGDRDLSR
jgi:hypothetical protein